MDALKSPETGAMTNSLIVLLGLMLIGIVLCRRLKEARLVDTA
jgi:LPXTG-motif cell wall-anchored protein